MFYVISPPGRTAWKVDRGHLIRLLKRDWPEFTLFGPDEGLATRDVIWTSADGELEGSQDVAGQRQYLTGRPQLIARYAAWWRQQVDPTQPLLLYDDGFTHLVPLDQGSTEAIILEGLES